MTALDFPASPTPGQTYPVPPVTGVPVYTWDGTKWTAVSGAAVAAAPATAIPLINATPGVVGGSTKYAREDHVHPTDTSRIADAPVDGKNYVRRDAVWTEMPHSQRISLSGLGLVDVQVPVGAVAVRISGIVSMTTAAPALYNLLQISVAPGVFKTATGDYQTNGLYITAGGTISPVSAHVGLAGYWVSAIQGSDTIPIFYDGFVQLKRKNASALFGSNFRTSGYSGTAYLHSFFQSIAVTAGSALDVLALRFTSTQPTNLWAAESYLNMEWL